MHMYITGFLPDESQDESLQYDFEVDSAFNLKIALLLGHPDLTEMMAGGVWTLSPDQASKLSELIGEPIPRQLQIQIGLVS